MNLKFIISFKSIILYCLIFMVFYVCLFISNRSILSNQLHTINKLESLEIIPNNFEYTTVISIYFSLRKSKHTPELYQIWIANTLTSIKAPMIIFTDNETKDYIYSIRRTMNYKTNIIVYENVWQIMRELELKRKKNYLHEYLNGNFSRNNTYSQDLYATWNVKAYLCNKAVEMNPYNSSFFIYTDMGAFRLHDDWNKSISIPEWPDNLFIRQLNVKLNNKILFGEIDLGDDYKIIEGGFFCGNSHAFKSFENIFYEEHDWEMENGYLFEGINDDQTIMTTLAYQTKRKMCIILKTNDLDCDRDYDPWFFYQYYLAEKEHYFCKENKFSLLLNL